MNPTSGVLLQASVTKRWFGQRLLAPQYNLESQGKYYAFGEERNGITPANPPNDQEKFATYTRDSATGLDYADQRYFSSVIGRFTRPDPFGGSANSMVPQTWNRYAMSAMILPMTSIRPFFQGGAYDSLEQSADPSVAGGGGL